jgi:energy-coupling factor transporter ATP-binding protein EcfA2
VTEAPVITLDRVGVRYADADRAVLSGIDLTVAEGELLLVAGPTGSGKSTLLGTLNGLVPRVTGGTLSGTVRVAGRNTRTHHPRDLADVVGWVGQDPAAGFVTDTVEDELAYGMESLGVAPAAMRARVEHTLDLLGLAALRSRPLGTLSGGQAQRVAIGSVLTAGARVLVLDEPTSALDPGAAEDVLGALARLVHDLGFTVVLAEHRLDRVLHHTDRVLLLAADGSVPRVGSPGAVLPGSAVAPPILRLAEVAGWSPAPLSVRDARRLAGPLRAALDHSLPTPTAQTAARPAAEPTVLARLRGVSLRYSGVPALDSIDLELAAGSVTALMGRNGAGKSSLLAVLAGLRRASSGTVRVGGTPGDRAAFDPSRARPSQVLHQVGLVPQDPGELLYADSVGAECRAADRDAGATPGTAAARLARLAPAVGAGTHPRDLSEGQRLCLALAVVLAADPPLLLLDEPTRGLDQPAKAVLVAILRDLADRGHGIVLATHDVELAAEVADRVVLLADGRVVVDGPAADVVTAAPAFAPQVAKILAPARWLTVSAVAAALDPDPLAASWE